MAVDGSKIRRPRVLFYSPAADFKGGAERSLMDLVVSPGIEPIVVSPAEGAVAKVLRDKGVSVHILPFGMIADIRRPFQLSDGARALVALFSCASSLKALCRREGIDFVHSNGLKAHAVAVVAKFMGGKPTVVHVRDIPLTKQEKLVWRVLAYASTRLVLVSRACWPWEALPTNALVIFNGIKLGTGARHEPTSGPLVVGFFGRIHQAKGLHLLVAWMKEAVAAGIDARLVIRGTFYDEAGDYKTELNAQVRDLGLADVVEFQGFRNEPEMVYEGIDAVCVPSHVPDPLPRAVMEAMALGLPVLAYPAGGILEMVEDGKDGFLVASAPAFVDALRRLQDDAVRAAIGRHAIERAKSQFSLSRLHGSIDRLYADLSCFRASHAQETAHGDALGKLPG